VIVIGASCGRRAEHIVDRIAIRTARHAALVKSLPVFNIVAISVPSRFRLSARCTRDSAWFPSFKLIYAVSLFINILGLGEHLPALEGIGLKRKILAE